MGAESPVQVMLAAGGWLAKLSSNQKHDSVTLLCHCPAGGLVNFSVRKVGHMQVRP